MNMSPLVRQRLWNQRLVGNTFATPGDIVAWFGAVQAQEYPGAGWGIAQRAESMTQATIDQAFADGMLLRTHVMRPTWHFVAPADLRWLLALTAPRVHALNAAYYRKLELDPATLTRGLTVLADALRDGAQLTRAELAAILDQAGITTADRLRLAYLIMYAELEGLICSGALRGKQHTYALLDTRIPPAPTLTRDEALATLAQRYFTSHGPATITDAAWWSGLTAADIKRGLELSRARLEMVVVDNQTYWRAPDASPSVIAGPIAHLLPAYDEYTIAYKDHRAILDQAYRSRVVAAFAIVIVIDGQIVGSWKRVVAKDQVVLTLTPFRTLSDAEQQAVDRAAQRYAAFLERPVEVRKQ